MKDEKHVIMRFGRKNGVELLKMKDWSWELKFLQYILPKEWEWNDERNEQRIFMRTSSFLYVVLSFAGWFLNFEKKISKSQHKVASHALIDSS